MFAYFVFCAHQVFDLMRKQEKTRLAELAADKSHNEAVQARKDIVSNFEHEGLPDVNGMALLSLYHL